MQGTVKITQSRATGYENGSEQVYTVSTVLSEAQEFSTYIMSKNPCALFLYQNGEYQKVVSMTEFDDTSPLVPDANGLIRKTSMSKSFSNAEQAIAYAKQQYEAITSFLMQLQDFAITLDNSVETDIIPNTSNSLLYQTVQEYLANKKKIEENEDKLIKAQAQYEAMSSISVSLASVFTKDNIAAYKTNLQTVNTTLSNTLGKLNLVKNSAVTAEASVTQVQNDLTEAKTYRTSAQTNWSTVKGDVIVTESNKDRNSLLVDTSFDEMLTKLNSASSGLTVTGFQTVSTQTLAAIADVTQAQTSINSTIADVLSRMTMVVGVSSNLTSQINTISETITTLQSERNGYLAEKNRLGAILTDLTDGSINLEDPMAIYNHRIFRFVD